MTKNAILNKLKEYKYISFDVFDTLVFRTVEKPYDQLQYISTRIKNIYGYDIPDFYETRIKAESEVRKEKKGKEITLDQIYSKLPYNFEIRENIKQEECNIEVEVCAPNVPMVDILNECKAEGKTIIIISDMYLPRSFFERIFKKIGINVDYIFISSEEGVTKRTGELFDVVLYKLGIIPTQLIHIGDDFNNDILQPQQHQINAIERVVGEPMDLSHSITVSNDIHKKNLELLIKLGLQNNRTKSDSFVLGYSVMGPFMVDFCQWLHKQKKENDLEKLLFVAREGYLIWKCYLTLYPEEKESVRYVNLNKNILRLPSLYNLQNAVENLLASLPKQKFYLIEDLCKFLQINEFDSFFYYFAKEFPGCSKNYRFEFVEFQNGKYINELEYLLNYQREQIYKQKEYLDQYLEENYITNHKVGLVNNSMNGSGQMLLEKYLESNKLKSEIFGLQFTSTNICKKRLGNRYAAFYSQKLFPKSYMAEIARCCYVLEHLMYEPFGTAISLYRTEDGIIAPQKEQQRAEKANNSFVNKEIDSAVQFCKDYKNGLKTPLNGVGGMLFIQMCLTPTYTEAKCISELWDDDSIKDFQINDMSIPFSRLNVIGRHLSSKIKWAEGYFVLNECSQIELFLYHKVLQYRRIKAKFQKSINH